MKETLPCDECLVMAMCKQKSKLVKSFNIMSFECNILEDWVFINDDSSYPTDVDWIRWQQCRNYYKRTQKDEK